MLPSLRPSVSATHQISGSENAITAVALLVKLNDGKGKKNSDNFTPGK
jgi:hypothetical protein